MNGFSFRSRRESATSLIILVLSLSLASSISAKNAPKSIAVIDSVFSDPTTLTHQVVYVDFWASWCVPCQHSLPWMRQLLDKYSKDGLKIVAVNVDRKASAGKAFLDQLNSPLDMVTDSSASWKLLTNSVLFDSTWTLAKKYDLEALPTSFIYGRDGNLRKQHQGFDESDTVYLDSLLTALLAEK